MYIRRKHNLCKLSTSITHVCLYLYWQTKMSYNLLCKLILLMWPLLCIGWLPLSCLVLIFPCGVLSSNTWHFSLDKISHVRNIFYFDKIISCWSPCYSGCFIRLTMRVQLKRYFPVGPHILMRCSEKTAGVHIPD